MSGPEDAEIVGLAQQEAERLTSAEGWYGPTDYKTSLKLNLLGAALEKSSSLKDERVTRSIANAELEHRAGFDSRRYESAAAAGGATLQRYLTSQENTIFQLVEHALPLRASFFSTSLLLQALAHEIATTDLEKQGSTQTTLPSSRLAPTAGHSA